MTSNEVTSLIKELEGVYRGFSPTDESAVMIGEIEAEIQVSGITVRHATGLMIHEEEIPADSLRQLSLEEIKALFIKDATTDTSQIKGLKVEDGVSLLFMPPDNENDPGLIVVGGLGDLLGSTILFSPSQIKQGMFDQAVQSLETQYRKPGILPRLSNNGKAALDF